MLELVLATHVRFTVVGFTAVATRLLGAFGTVVPAGVVTVKPFDGGDAFPAASLAFTV